MQGYHGTAEAIRRTRRIFCSDILAVVESVTENPLAKGNKVTLLIDGAVTYAAMFSKILIVDGKVAIIGGITISKVYSGIHFV